MDNLKLWLVAPWNAGSKNGSSEGTARHNIRSFLATKHISALWDEIGLAEQGEFLNKEVLTWH